MNKKTLYVIAIIGVLLLAFAIVELFPLKREVSTKANPISEETQGERDAQFTANCKKVGGKVTIINTPAGNTAVMCDKDFGEPADYYIDNR